MDRLSPGRRLKLKILEQIVDYLAQRGAITPEEVNAFEAAGFIRTEAERHPEYDERYDDYDEPEPYEALEPSAPARPRARGRKYPPLKAPVLAARLRAALRAADPHLRTLA